MSINCVFPHSLLYRLSLLGVAAFAVSSPMQSWGDNGVEEGASLPLTSIRTTELSISCVRGEAARLVAQIDDGQRSTLELLDVEETTLRDKLRKNQPSDGSAKKSSAKNGEDKNSEDKDEQDRGKKERADRSRSDARSGALDRLRRPLGEIRIPNYVSNVDGPKDQAAEIAESLSTIEISATNERVPQYDRQTTCLSHRPLYFEDSNLELCGNSWGCLQNPISAARFTHDVLTLPYHLVKQRPGCLVPPTPECRCGECFVNDLDPRPIDCRGVVAQCAVIAGFTFLVL